MSSNGRKANSRTINTRRKALLESAELLRDVRLEVDRELELGNSRNHLFPVLYGSAENKSTTIVDTRTKHQPVLRLVVNLDPRFEVPRRYDQSTSGRMSSTGTTPPLSRSRAMAVDSAILSFVERALRKYPMDVSQRSAYASWASRSRELRYVRSDSIRQTLPDSNVLAIPFVHLRRSPSSQNEQVDKNEQRKEEQRRVRRRRLKELVKELGRGSRATLAGAIDAEPNYISQLVSDRLNKSFGEETARKLEVAAGKPKYWLDSAEPSAWKPQETDGGWPFSFDRALWDGISPARRRELESTLHATLLGVSAIEAAAAQSKKLRPG